MKQKCSFILRSSIALLLTALMIIGSISTVLAATVDMADIGRDAEVASTGVTSCTIYIYPADLWSDYASYTIKCNANIGDNNTWVQNDFTDTGHTINGKAVYSATFSAKYDGVDALQIQKYNGSTWITQYQPYSSWTTASTFNGKIYNGNTWATKPAYDTIKTPLTTPTISIGGKTSGATVASGSTAAVKITNWSSFSGSISAGYCTLALYKGDTKIGNNITSETTNFTFTESGDYYVKCEPTASTEATYSASSSSTVDVTVTLTIYVKNAADWSDIYYYVYTSDSSHGPAWPGTKIASTAIGTIDGKNVYKVENVPQYSYIILNVGSSSAQYPNNVALANGKLYPTGTTAPTVVDYSSSLLDKPKYDVTFTPSPTGGTVKVNNSSTSPAKVTEDEDFTILAKPNTGYTIDTVKVGTTTLTAQSGGSDASGYTYTSNVGKADKTVTATFKKVNYTVTLNKNANDATAGTDSVTAQYGSNMPSATMPTRTGYTFAGYYDTSATSGGTQYYTAAGASARTWNKTANTTLYARWTEVTGGAVAKAYTSGSASSTGGTVKIGTSGSASGSVNLSAIGITSSNTVIATTKSNYSFTGWQFSGTNATHLRYRFGTSGEWLTPATGTTYGTSSNTTIYIKTDGSSGITTSNAEVRALFVPTEYSVSVGAQYTEDGTTYTDFQTLPSGVTIAANTATYQTGVAVAAPGTDPTGYVFAGWYTANGSFTNSANKDTTFKPNAANAVAIAKYKKIFSITSSVDNTGTGAGTASTSVTSVVAGGSYTITATAANGSAIESVKVNGTAKTATESQTISSVSADQTVVVKFKSIIQLGNKGFTDKNNTWKTPEMSSAGSNKYSIKFTAQPAREYNFKVVDGTKSGDAQYINSYANDAFDNGGTSSTIALNTSDENNIKLTLSEACDVTIIYDVSTSKITSILLDPTDSTTYAITVGSPADAVLTATYRGTEYAEGQTINARAGQQITFSATTTESKYVSGYTLGGAAVTSPHTVAASDNGKTLTCSVADKLTVKAVTNKSARGTVTVDKSFAAPGESITITISPAAGILKTLTATYTTSGNTYECAVTNGTAGSTWTKVIASGGAAAPLKARGSVEIAEVGANIALAAVGASQTVNMTMQENSAVTINATFDNYSGDSTWYYNGYDGSGNALSGYHGKQMTEGMVSGEKFSYYHVVGRTGDDHLFTVSDGKVAETRYVYFTRPNAFGYWNQSNSPKAHFWKNGGSDYDTWPGNNMTWVYNNDMGQGVFKIAIPVGADRVSFNDGSNSGTQQTVDIDLTNTSGAYYVSQWNDSAQKYDYGTWDTGYSDQGWIASGTEYFYDSEKYTSDFSTKGFYNHNVSGTDFTKPKDLGTSKGDYYINVLYPGKTYTINGVTKTIGSKPMIIWSTEPLANDGDTVKVYAKDGSIRSESYGSTYANIADTKIFEADGTTAAGTKVSGSIANQTYETYNAGKGDTLVIKTQIGATDSSTLSNAADLKAKYYVRGFCVNGEVSELLEWNANGLYTLTYKVPEDYEGTKIEITPIYYLKDTTNNPIVTYRVTGFTDELKAVGAGKPGWGDTLYTYPFYGKLGSNNNALGAYPGQPMVYYKGQYQMQIPQKSTAWDIYYDDGALSGYSGNTAKANAVANTAVSGVTMSNGYYDIVHRQVMGYGSNGASSDHVQTYDYGDFFKIFNEKEPVDNIVFDFKYRTKKHNFENQPAATISKSDLDTNYGTNGNGFELLTNFHGRTVDLFGTPLSGDAADPSKTTPVYVISIGGVNGSAGVENIAGYYATEWMVYGSSNGSSYSRISADGKSSIPPEVLVLNDDDATSFNTTTYPSADANHTLTDWKALYTALEAYRGKPVMISYEAADAQIGAGNYATSGGGGATRNDGRWLYSKNGETITSKIRVDVSEDNGATYTPNTQVENLDAYFTNAEADGETTYTTTIDPDKTFDFEAHSGNEDYKFMGWYMEDGTKITTDNIGHTERSGSYTFVARFMHFTGGQLILGHKVAKDSTYTGDGTATIAVKVKNGDEIVREWAASSSDVTIDDKIINNENTAYTIEVTLNATPAGEDSYARTACSAADTFFGGHSTYTTMPQTFSFTVGSLFSGSNQVTKKITYNSYFNQVTYTYKYTFNFPSRGSSSNDKSYVREGTLTAAQRKDYVTGTGNESRVLSEAFVNSLAPHESNFNQTLTWSISATDRTFTKDGSNYTLTKTVNAVDRTAQVDGGGTLAQGEVVRTAKRTATFNLPYAHTNGVPSNIEIMDKAESTNYVISGICYGSLVKKDGDNGYIVAPRQLNDGGTVKNFQYWSVKSTDAAGENDPDVARCYFYSFNFVAYDNYVITPVYDTGSTPFGNSNRTSTSITYLESSRNQFNGTGVTTTNMATAADILYNDFVLSYEYNGKDIYKNDDSSSDVSQIGYVVERVQKLEVGQDGTPYTDPNHYSDVTVKSEEEIKNMISSNTGKTVATSGTLTKYTLTKNSLDNKNRVEFYESYINSKGWNEDTQKPQQTSGYKNYVYKAYTYMIVNGVVTLSAPAYFTMYSEATM